MLQFLSFCNRCDCIRVASLAKVMLAQATMKSPQIQSPATTATARTIAMPLKIGSLAQQRKCTVCTWAAEKSNSLRRCTPKCSNMYVRIEPWFYMIFFCNKGRVLSGAACRRRHISCIWARLHLPPLAVDELCCPWIASGVPLDNVQPRACVDRLVSHSAKSMWAIAKARPSNHPTSHIIMTPGSTQTGAQEANPWLWNVCFTAG